MRVTIKSLRTGIVVLAGLLVLALFLFFAYARYQMRRIGKDLPARLGLQIQQSAKDYTITHSDKKGHPVFTVHASKAVRFKNGHASLHDVGITLYGPNGDSADRIYGSDFDYDEATGIASATGEVQIDLSSPAEGKSPPPKTAGDDDAAQRTIHVKTSGLSFNQKTGVATTEQEVEFHLPKAAGKAVGATYDSQMGLLVLNHAVEITSSTNGAPFLVHASHAQLLRDNRQAFLLNAATDFRNERSFSDQAIVYFRADGSASHIDAKGNVHLETDAGQNLKAQSAAINLDAQSQPTHAELGGGLLFISEDKVHHMRGNAVEGSLQFGSEASLRHVQLRNAVSFVDQQLALPDDPKGSATREVRASKLDVDFAPGPDDRPAAQKAFAAGGAIVILHTISNTGPQQNTTIAADQLLATLANGNSITALNGSGHTSLTTQAPDGATQTSTGDTLDIAFAPVALKPAAKSKAGQRAAKSSDVLESSSSRLQSAVQQGNVTMTQTPAPAPDTGKTGAPSMHATAQRAEYHSSDQVLHLLGSPRLNDGSLDLSAKSIDFHRDSGDATATGDVKATYIQLANASGQTNGASPSPGPALGGQGPAHVVAAEASMSRASGEAIFRGQARLWQGTNSVAAPSIELSRTHQTLNAYGEGDGAPVNAVFAMASDPKHKQAVIRIHSRDLLYSEAERLANFRGSVVADDPSGTIRSDRADVFLVPSSAPGQSSGQSQLDRMIASGHVTLSQPGRKGTGEKLVYTQQDGRCVLTGTSGAAPRLSDQVHGTVTGASLIFNTRDDSVSVNGGQSSAVTDTRVSK
jgi:lipopolysaccharide export system protein LptA